MPLFKMKGAIRHGSSFRVVGNHHDGFVVIPGQGVKEVEDRPSGFPIKVTGGFIGYEETWVVDDGPGNSHPLFLSSRKLGRTMVNPVRETYEVKGCFHPFPALGLGEWLQEER